MCTVIYFHIFQVKTKTIFTKSYNFARRVPSFNYSFHLFQVHIFGASLGAFLAQKFAEYTHGSPRVCLLLLNFGSILNYFSMIFFRCIFLVLPWVHFWHRNLRNTPIEAHECAHQSYAMLSSTLRYFNSHRHQQRKQF